MTAPLEKTAHGGPMPCSKCGSRNTATADSRPSNGSIRRRRLCTVCDHRFTTYEVTVEEGGAFDLAMKAGTATKLSVLVAKALAYDEICRVTTMVSKQTSDFLAPAEG